MFSQENGTLPNLQEKKHIPKVHKLIGNERQCISSLYKASIKQYLSSIEYKKKLTNISYEY